MYNQTFETPIEQKKLEYKSVEDEQTGETVGGVQQVIIPENLADQKRLFYARVQRSANNAEIC